MHWIRSRHQADCDGPVLQALGVTQLWLPPPSNSVSKQGYLPGQLYDLETPYGTKDELMALLSQLKEAGIASLADIVINHRCADEQDEKGRWNKFACARLPPARVSLPALPLPCQRAHWPVVDPQTLRRAPTCVCVYASQSCEDLLETGCASRFPPPQSPERWHILW